jgi:hypothetical protein
MFAKPINWVKGFTVESLQSFMGFTNVDIQRQREMKQAIERQVKHQLMTDDELATVKLFIAGEEALRPAVHEIYQLAEARELEFRQAGKWVMSSENDDVTALLYLEEEFALIPDTGVKSSLKRQLMGAE